MALAKAPFRQTAIADRLHKQANRGSNNAESKQEWEALKALHSAEAVVVKGTEGVASSASSSANAVVHTAEVAAKDAAGAASAVGCYSA